MGRIIKTAKVLNPFRIAFRAGEREGRRGDPLFSGITRPITKRLRRKKKRKR